MQKTLKNGKEKGLWHNLIMELLNVIMIDDNELREFIERIPGTGTEK